MRTGQLSALALCASLLMSAPAGAATERIHVSVEPLGSYAYARVYGSASDSAGGAIDCLMTISGSSGGTFGPGVPPAPPSGAPPSSGPCSNSTEHPSFDGSYETTAG